MNIAVIGDYESLQYKDLLQTVKMHFPADKVLDLSLIKCADEKRAEKLRQEEIKTCIIFIYDYKWEYDLKIRRDISYALMVGKDPYFYSAGKFYTGEMRNHSL